MTDNLTFIDKMVSRKCRFSIGMVRETGAVYLSIPVSNQRVDYEEYYNIDQKMFDRFISDPKEANWFAERCRQRKEDARLILAPGADRGSAS